MEEPLGRVERPLQPVAGTEGRVRTQRLPRLQPLDALGDGRPEVRALRAVGRRQAVGVADERGEEGLDLCRAQPYVVEGRRYILYPPLGVLVPLTDVPPPERPPEVVRLPVLDHGEVGREPDGEGVGSEEAAAEPVDRVDAGGVELGHGLAHAPEPDHKVFPIDLGPRLVERGGELGRAGDEPAVRLRAELGRGLPRERDGDDLAQPRREVLLACLDEREEPAYEGRRLARPGPGLDGERTPEVVGRYAEDTVALRLVGEGHGVVRELHRLGYV